MQQPENEQYEKCCDVPSAAKIEPWIELMDNTLVAEYRKKAN